VQNADYIHALEGGASMAATGATGIAGGNYQIFEKFIVESGANVYLDTPVGFVDYYTEARANHRNVC
jgi:prenylcysteine oxidase/farnesylcysteine lyase